MMVSQITAWEGGVDGEDEGLAGQVAWIQTNTCLVFQLKREEKSVVVFFFREVRENQWAGINFERGGGAAGGRGGRSIFEEKSILTCVQIEFDMGIFLFFR